MSYLRIVPAAVFLGVSLLASSASADSGLFLSLPPVKGLSTVENRKDWIDIGSLQWGVGVAVDWSRGGGVGKASASDIVWTQEMDSTYPQLLQKLTAAPGGTAQFDVVRSAAQQMGPYLSLQTTGTAVDGVSFANMSVSGSLAYSSIKMTWDPTGVDPRSQDKPISTTFDMLKNTVSTSGKASTVPVGKTGPLAAGSGETKIYLRLGDNLSLAGGSTAQGYENWFLLDSAQFGAGRSVGSGGNTGTTSSSSPSFSELTVTGQAGAALPAIFAALASGTKLPNATLEYVQGGPQGPVTFMQMYMEDVFLSSLSLSAGGGDLVSYSESLSFAKFSQTVWAIDKDGTQGAASKFGYDALKQKTMTGTIAPSVSRFGAGNLTGMPATAESQSAPGGSVSPVPEPGQWALLLAGLGLMAAVARRRAVR